MAGGSSTPSQRSRKCFSPGGGGFLAPSSAARAWSRVTTVWLSAPSLASALQVFSVKLTRSIRALAPPISPRPMASVRAVRRIASRITPVETVARAITGGRSPRASKAVSRGLVRSSPSNADT